MIDRLAAILEKHAKKDGATATEIPRVHTLRSTQPTEPIHILHQPAVCFVAQGRKQTLLADEVYFYEPPQFLIVSVDLPIVGQVVEASEDRPYLCLRLDLDPAVISEVITEVPPSALRSAAPARGIDISTAPAELLDAVVRLVSLLDSERDSDRKVLAPLIEREILYRLLMGDQAVRLQQIAYAESKLSQIGKAVAMIKSNYSRLIRVDDVAAHVNMSVSSFHQHFRTVTSMSPLQYQKQIRLQEARKLMLAKSLDAATAGFMVGYESPSQFSREYSRLFGLSPRRDVDKLRNLPDFV